MIVTTFPTQEEAKNIVKQLLEEKLIACANIFPSIKSFYWWENAIQEDSECIAFLKTQRELERDVIEKIKSLHSYKVPAIYAIESMQNISKSYLEWIYEVTNHKIES